MQHRRIATNALWNLVSVGSGALLAVAVPPFLTRALGAEVFGAWALVLQITAYVHVLNFGMQTVVARHVAIALGAGSRRQRDAIVSTAFWVLVGAAALAGILIVIAALRIDWIFPSLSQALRPEASAAVLLVGTALALSLPTTVFAGVFVGLQRNEVPALTNVTSRLLLAVGVVIAARTTGSLSVMASAYASAVLVGIVAQFLLWRRMVECPSVATAHMTAPAGRALADECGGIMVWNLSMLLVAGLDLVIVARVDYAMVPYFAVAATLTALLGGLMQATGSATLPVAARMIAQGDKAALTSLVDSSTRINGSLGLLATVPLVWSGAWLLELWVGADYAGKSASLLAVLAVAGAVRTSTLPYVTAAVSAGLQRRIVLTPVTEGVVNLVCSIALGLQFGAIGVALGTLAGAIVGVVGLLLQHPLQRTVYDASATRFFVNALLPLYAVLALVVAGLLTLPEAFLRSAWGVLGGLAVVSLCCMLGVFTADDRRAILGVLTRRAAAPH